MTLTFGFTPCPNDAFAFHALVHGLIPARFDVEPVLLDIEELNRRSAGGELQLTKLSFGAAAASGARYRLLRSGAALGRGVGPLVVAREAGSLEDASRGRIAVPGRETTAFLLLRLAAPVLGDALQEANETLEADFTVSEQDGHGESVRPFTREELLKPLEKWFFGRS